MKKWYDMTKEELKESVREEELNLFIVILEIEGIFQKEDKKNESKKAISLLIKVFRELSDENHKFSKDYLLDFNDGLLFKIIRHVKLTEDAINDIINIEKYYDDDYISFLLVRHQSFTEENIETYLKNRHSCADLWFLFTYQDLASYPLLIFKYADLSAIPPEYFVTKFNWDEIFSSKLDSDIQNNLIRYLLDNYLKGLKVEHLEDNEYVECYFDECDDWEFWDNLGMDRRLVNLEGEEYYDVKTDTLYINYWHYLIRKLIQTQELDENLRKGIDITIPYNREGEYDYCKKIAEKYGEAEIKIFIRIHKKLKEDGLINKMDYLNAYFGED